jgi:hypothetical protein
MTTYTIAADIRRKIAEAIVTEEAPGYARQYRGQYYAVDTNGDNELDAVMFRESTAQWNPWHDTSTAISVEEIYADVDADFSDEVEEGYEDDAIDFAEGELPEAYNAE